MVKERSIILRAHKYGEADLIIKALNRQGSKVGYFARAALKSRKRFGGGVLEPSHYVEVSYRDSAKSSSEGLLYSLNEAHLIKDFQGIRSEYRRLEQAFYFLKVIENVAKEGNESPELFNLLGNALHQLQTEDHVLRLKIHFEVKLLHCLGVLDFNDEISFLLKTPLLQRSIHELSDEQWMHLRDLSAGYMRQFAGEFGLRL
jgi:DNA repair protein RecO (recombination protein O)